MKSDYRLIETRCYRIKRPFISVLHRPNDSNLSEPFCSRCTSISASKNLRYSYFISKSGINFLGNMLTAILPNRSFELTRKSNMLVEQTGNFLVLDECARNSIPRLIYIAIKNFPRIRRTTRFRSISHSHRRLKCKWSLHRRFRDCKFFLRLTNLSH